MSQIIPKKELTIKEMERAFNLFQRRVMRLEDEFFILKRDILKTIEARQIGRIRKGIKETS